MENRTPALSSGVRDMSAAASGRGNATAQRSYSASFESHRLTRSACKAQVIASQCQRASHGAACACDRRALWSLEKNRYLIETFAPASSSSFFSFSASSFEMPSLTLLGTPSTRSLASFRPRPVAADYLDDADLLIAESFQHDVEFGLFGSRRRAAATIGRSGHHHRAAGSRLDAVGVFQVVAQLFGLLQGQAHDLVTQFLGHRGVFQRRCFAHDLLDPFTLGRAGGPTSGIPAARQLVVVGS